MSPDTVDAPTRTPANIALCSLATTVRTQCHGSESSPATCNSIFDKSPKSPNSANRFGKLIFKKKCQTWTVLPDEESPPEYFILGKFRKP